MKMQTLAKKVMDYIMVHEVLARTIGVQEGFTESETEQLDRVLNWLVYKKKLVKKGTSYSLPNHVLAKMAGKLRF